MALQTTNFLNAPVLTPNTAIANLFSNILKTSKERHENTIKGEEAKYAPENERFKNLIKKAESENAPEYFKERAKMGGLANIFQALLNSKEQQFGAREKEAEIQEKQAHTEYLKKGGGRSGGIWRNLPQDTRAKMIAQGNAWDIDPEVIANHINSGGSFEELREQARANGVDVENAPLIFDPTAATRTSLQSIESAADEVDYLEKKLAPGITMYGPTINGYSPEQIADAISGDNPEEQATFLASRALQPEMAGARARLANSSNAHEALKEIKEAALGEFKIFEAFLTPEVRALTQKKINDWLRGAAQVRVRTMKGQKPKGKENEDESTIDKNRRLLKESEEFGKHLNNKMIKGSKNGKSFEIPADKADAFIKAGGRISG